MACAGAASALAQQHLSKGASGLTELGRSFAASDINANPMSAGMVMNVDRKRRVEAKPLETRQAFLDTQVYRKLRHNPANKALRLLAEHVADYRLVLHITDITLREIDRHIADDVEQTRVALARARKDVARWRHSVPDLAPLPELDAGAAAGLARAFRRSTAEDWKAREHVASEHPAAPVFADYFARKAPFDGPGGKEFPDSFVMHTLEAWCAANGEFMHVVTQDAAMKRFADASPYLIPLDTIEELLAAASASAADDAKSEKIAESLLNLPAFDRELEEEIRSRLGDLIVSYDGDLPEGEVSDVGFSGGFESLQYQVVSRTTSRLGLLADVDLELDVSITHEDRSFAIHDREEDTWIGADWEVSETSSPVTLELYLELNIATGRITTSELIRSEYRVR